jgi:hypothetical protein
MSSFYSSAVKMTSAKKVGTLLGLSAEEVFAQEVQVLTEPEAVEREVLVVEETVAVKDEMPVAASTPSQVEVVSEDQSHTTHAPTALVEEPKSKTSLWVIAGLFAAALAVAAYMQPKDEPAVEIAPPLQVLPAEITEPASAASAADLTASAAEVLGSPASSVNSGASAPRMSVPAASGVATVMPVRPASAILTAPALSASSKAP